jgi:hypothetical protein
MLVAAKEYLAPAAAKSRVGNPSLTLVPNASKLKLRASVAIEKY